MVELKDLKKPLINKVLDCTRISLGPDDVLCVNLDPTMQFSVESQKHLKEMLIEAFGPDQKFICTRGVEFTIVTEKVARLVYTRG